MVAGSGERIRLTRFAKKALSDQRQQVIGRFLTVLRDDPVESVEVDGHQTYQGREAVRPRECSAESFLEERSVGEAGLPVLVGVAKPTIFGGLAGDCQFDPSTDIRICEIRRQQHIVRACLDGLKRYIGA